MMKLILIFDMEKLKILRSNKNSGAYFYKSFMIFIWNLMKVIRLEFTAGWKWEHGKFDFFYTIFKTQFHTQCSSRELFPKTRIFKSI